MNEKKYLRPQDIADEMGWNRETVYLKLQKGTLPGFQIDGQWFVKSDDWKAFMAGKGQTEKEGLA